jgi:hypothetical protein
MTKGLRIAAIAGLALVSACTASTRPGPVDVTRFHLGGAPERTTVKVEPATGAAQVNPEWSLYGEAVTVQLERLGYVRSTSEMQSGYIAAVGFTQRSLGEVRKRAPVTIGLGGGSFGGNVGVGGGASFGIGGGRATLVETELSVQLRRRSDNTTIWEGRAITQGIGESNSPALVAPRLASVLFRDFPGESGITITVK